MSEIRCGVCQQMFDSESSNTAPFCSNRCRQIDLGRWLDEQYSLPSDISDEAEPEQDESDLQ